MAGPGCSPRQNCSNLKTHTFVTVGDMNEARAFATATAINNRFVLVAGGVGNGGVLDSAELFDLKTRNDGR